MKQKGNDTPRGESRYAKKQRRKFGSGTRDPKWMSWSENPERPATHCGDAVKRRVDINDPRTWPDWYLAVLLLVALTILGIMIALLIGAMLTMFRGDLR